MPVKSFQTMRVADPEIKEIKMWNKIKECLKKIQLRLCVNATDIQLEELRDQYQAKVNDNIHLHHQLSEYILAVDEAKALINELNDKLAKAQAVAVGKPVLPPNTKRKEGELPKKRGPKSRR